MVVLKDIEVVIKKGNFASTVFDYTTVTNELEEYQTTFPADNVAQTHVAGDVGEGEHFGIFWAMTLTSEMRRYNYDMSAYVRGKLCAKWIWGPNCVRPHITHVCDVDNDGEVVEIRPLQFERLGKAKPKDKTPPLGVATCGRSLRDVELRVWRVQLRNDGEKGSDEDEPDRVRKLDAKPVYVDSKKRPYAIFKFRYNSEAMLKRMGIMPKHEAPVVKPNGASVDNSCKMARRSTAPVESKRQSSSDSFSEECMDSDQSEMSFKLRRKRTIREDPQHRQLPISRSTRGRLEGGFIPEDEEWSNAEDGFLEDEFLEDMEDFDTSGSSRPTSGSLSPPPAYLAGLKFLMGHTCRKTLTPDVTAISEREVYIVTHPEDDHNTMSLIAHAEIAGKEGYSIEKYHDILKQEEMDFDPRVHEVYYDNDLLKVVVDTSKRLMAAVRLAATHGLVEPEFKFRNKITSSSTRADQRISWFEREEDF